MKRTRVYCYYKLQGQRLLALEHVVYKSPWRLRSSNIFLLTTLPLESSHSSCTTQDKLKVSIFASEVHIDIVCQFPEFGEGEGGKEGEKEGRREGGKKGKRIGGREWGREGRRKEAIPSGGQTIGGIKELRIFGSLMYSVSSKLLTSWSASHLSFDFVDLSFCQTVEQNNHVSSNNSLTNSFLWHLLCQFNSL